MKWLSRVASAHMVTGNKAIMLV